MKGRNISHEEMRCECNNSNGRYRGPTECNSGFDHGFFAASSATRLPYYAAVMQSANIIQESWNVAVWPFSSKGLGAYAGCRPKACTVPERLVGMGKAEWGLGMLHKRLGLCSFFSHTDTTQKSDISLKVSKARSYPSLPILLCISLLLVQIIK